MASGIWELLRWSGKDAPGSKPPINPSSRRTNQITVYKNFLKNFPARCLEILDMTWKKAQENDKEVTLSLMVASAGFVVPFELLRPPPESSPEPSPRKSYPTHSKILEELMKKPFLESYLCSGTKAGWLSGKYNPEDGDLDACEDLIKKKKMPSEKTVGAVLKGMRDALAHGNIHTTGKSTITLIVFIIENSEAKKKFIGVPPEEFLIFLRNWFKFAKEHDQSEIAIKNTIGPAKDKT